MWLFVAVWLRLCLRLITSLSLERCVNDPPQKGCWKFCTCATEHVCRSGAFAWPWGCNYGCMCMNISLRQIAAAAVCIASSSPIRSHNTSFSLQLNWFVCSFKSEKSMFIFLYVPYWSKDPCLELYCISAYCISSFHLFAWQRLAPSTEGPLHGRTHQMGIQINLSGHVWPTHYWRFD